MKSILLSATLAVSFTLGAQAAPAISLQQVAEGFVSPTALQSLPNADYMLVSDQKSGHDQKSGVKSYHLSFPHLTFNKSPIPILTPTLGFASLFPACEKARRVQAR